MIQLTRQDVQAHQTHVPWARKRQIEQDLLLCRAMAALFQDDFLQGQIAMRGGTLLHKVYLVPPSRYSEDIDLVITGSRPEDHILKAIRRVLKDVLGSPVLFDWDNVALPLRNLFRPSRLLRTRYSVPAVSEAVALEILIEINPTERKPHRQLVKLPFEFPFQGSVVKTVLNGYDIHEMLGTKMRALFQRSRGRDLFDLYWALTTANPAVNPIFVIESFEYYLTREGRKAGHAQFITGLNSRLADRGFCSDMIPLMRAGISYDAQKAGAFVKEHLIDLLAKSNA